MKAINIIIATVNSMCLIILLLALAIQTPAFGIWFYKYEFNKNSSYDAVNMEKDELNKVAGNLISYLRSGEPELADVRAVVAGRERYFFGEREAEHMEDVRVLFSIGLTARNASAICFFITLIYFFFQNTRLKRKLLLIWRAFSGGTLALFGLAAALAALNFDRAFTFFHEVLFVNDLWLLNPETDLLINILPSGFFQDIALFIAGMFAVLLITILAGSFILCRILKKRL